MAVETDLFQADFTSIAGIYRGSQAQLSFIDNAQTYVLGAMNVVLKYTEKPQLIMLPKTDADAQAKFLVFAPPATGMVSIGTLLGKDLWAFVDKYGDLCGMDSDDPLTITLLADVSCGGEGLDVLGEVEIECYNVKLDDIQISVTEQGFVIGTNLSLTVLNMKRSS